METREEIGIFPQLVRTPPASSPDAAAPAPPAPPLPYVGHETVSVTAAAPWPWWAWVLIGAGLAYLWLRRDGGD